MNTTTTALRWADWPVRLQELARRNAVGACLGDSHMNGIGSDLATLLTAAFGFEWLDLGVNGERTDQIAARRTLLASNGVNIALINGGINDLAQGYSFAAFLANWRTILDYCAAQSIYAIVLEMIPADNYSNAIHDLRVKWNSHLNHLVSQYANAQSLNIESLVGQWRLNAAPGNLYDLQPAYNQDDFHLSPAGNQILADAVVALELPAAHLIGTGGGSVSASAVASAMGSFTALQQETAVAGLVGDMTGQGGRQLVVKGDESGLEFATPAGAAEALAKVQSITSFGPRLVGWTGDGAAISSFSNETSTFSGWGNTYTAPVPAFNRVRIYGRFWDGTDPVTTINIQVRQTDRSGTVLATGSAAWTAAEDTVGYADVTLSATVNEAGNVFIGYWGNGKMGFPIAVSKTGRLVNVSSSLAYTTGQSGTPTWSASGTNTYICAFNLYLDTQYDPEAFTERFEDLIATKTISTIITDRWRGIVLPSTIYALEGRELNLWYANCHDSSFADTDLEWVVTAGTENNRMRRLNRGWRYTPAAADAGTTTLSVSCYHRNTLLETKVCTLVTKALSVGNGITRRVWTIGDSTADGPLAELLNLFNYNKNSPTAGGGADVMTIDHSKGADSGSGNDAEGNLRSFRHDGNSGFSTTSYASGTTQFGTAMNGIDAWEAANATTMVSGDWIIIHLGLNGLLSATTNVANLVTILTALRADLPAGIRFLLLPTYGPSYGDDGSGGIYYGNDNMQWRKWRLDLMALRNAMIAEFEDDSDVVICGAYHNLDTRYNYPFSTVAVNARNSTTEPRQNNLIHPDASGYYQIADSIKCALKCQET